MGLPQVNIVFQTLAISAIERSQKGIVALILKDNTVATSSITYNSIDEVKASDWTVQNKDFIDKTFMGTPSKVIVERVPVAATDYNAALTRLKHKKWNYLAIPQIVVGEVMSVATWIKAARDNDKKTFKAVLPNSASDHEGIINFSTEEIKVGDTTYTGTQYTARIAGILAGLPFTRSATYYALPEVTAIKESLTPNEDIDGGKLILINDGEKIKIGRGINSLTTSTVSKSAKFKKVKIVDAIDLIREDIRNTFENEYVGQVNNFYDNKMLFISSINAYFKMLQKDEVLDPNFDAVAELDLLAQKNYLQSVGVDVTTLSNVAIREYNTGSKLFIKAKGAPLDAMEDLDFSMLII